MNTSKKIPPSLISKLEQVKLYMAKRRVTAFIGAGFSLNAEMPSHVKMKTWVQLREDFLNKLYGDDEEAKKRTTTMLFIWLRLLMLSLNAMNWMKF